MKCLLYPFAALVTVITLHAHDSFEITLEIQEKRNRTEAHLEMARSTAVASCNPAPSNGVLFEPSEFPEWESKFLEAAPSLIQLVDTEGIRQPISVVASLTREDDVRLDYIFPSTEEDPYTLATPILSRFPPDGFGVRVSFRDKSGHWYPPFMIFVDRQSSTLPPG